MKVLTYNIHAGGGGRLAAIAEIIRRHRPDAVALQEVTSPASVAPLAAGLHMDVAFGEANCDHHLAWLSRPPIRRAVNHRDPALAKTLLEIEIDGPEGGRRLFATHLASRHDPPHPVDEVAVILARLRPIRELPHLLAGDFNSLHPDDAIGAPPPGVTPRLDPARNGLAIGRMLAADYVDCFRALHPRAPGHTYASGAPWLRLDFIFASPALAARLAGCGTVRGRRVARASDHVPVWAAFR